MDFFIILLMFRMFRSSGSEVKSLNSTGVLDLSDNYPHPAIIEGYPAHRNEFSFAVRLYIHRSKGLTMCTGEIVHVRLIITAAHCVALGGSMIAVGGYENQNNFFLGRHLERYFRYRIVDVFVHPHFDPTEYTHDVALVKTARPMIHRGSHIIDISYDKLPDTVNVTIFGWGGTETNQHNNILFGKHLAASTCTLDNVSSNKYEYICLLEKGICHGDSGGGLIYNDTLFGIASFYQKGEVEVCLGARSYFYTSMHEEKPFVKDCISKNGINYNRPFPIFILVIFFLVFLV